MPPVLHSITYYSVKNSEIRITEREHICKKEREDRFLKHSIQRLLSLLLLLLLLRLLLLLLLLEIILEYYYLIITYII